jgi:hypothetical protein
VSGGPASALDASNTAAKSEREIILPPKKQKPRMNARYLAELYPADSRLTRGHGESQGGGANSNP